MTLEEKVGQMNQYNGFWESTGLVANEEEAKWKNEHIRKRNSRRSIKCKRYRECATRIIIDSTFEVNEDKKPIAPKRKP